jgi:hypothetical protein
LHEALHLALVEKNPNSKSSVQLTMLVGKNGTMIVRRLRMIAAKRAIRGQDGRGRTPLPIKTFKCLKREKFWPL